MSYYLFYIIFIRFIYNTLVSYLLRVSLNKIFIGKYSINEVNSLRHEREEVYSIVIRSEMHT